MKKLAVFTAALLAFTVIFGSIDTAAADFDSLDAGTAMAGSSYVLQNFIESNPDASHQIAEALFSLGKISGDDAFSMALSVTDESVTGEEIEYSLPREGVADVEAFLNVRTSPSTMTEVIDGILRGGSVKVIGEWLVHGETWYKVTVNDRTGYVHGDYLLFDEDAEAFKEQVLEEAKEAAVLPDEFKIPDDISELPEDVQAELTRLANEITYILSVDFPEADKDDAYMNMYSILIYLMENFEQVIRLAEDNDLPETKKAAEQGVNLVELNRLKLSDRSGETEEELMEDLVSETVRRQEEAAELARQAEEARRAAEAAQEAEQRAAAQAIYEQQAAAAQQAAQAAQEAQQQDIQDAMNHAAESNTSTGGQIAAFAAQWVGRIPYVWGGNAFYEGGGVDCSHFTYNVLRQFGLCGYYENSYGQRNWGRAIDISEIQPGDLVCYDGHVAIYYGDGQIVHAPAPGRYIEYGSLYVKPVISVRRMY